ncbi:MAG: hypothetical protein NTW27_12390 [Deltaproteobacteria bacterium]|nr:hypothetical protein [Deltaproteobacteria bacterium]
MNRRERCYGLAESWDAQVCPFVLEAGAVSDAPRDVHPTLPVFLTL